MDHCEQTAAAAPVMERGISAPAAVGALQGACWGSHALLPSQIRLSPLSFGSYLDLDLIM